MKYLYLFWRIFRALLNYIKLNKETHLFGIEFMNRCRLGNQMFFITAGETLRKRHGWNVVYYTPVKKDYLAIDEWIFKKVDILTFNLPLLKFENRISEADLLSEEQSKTGLYDRNLKKHNILCSGYYENLELVDRSIAKELFKIPEKIRKEIEQAYGDLSDYVSIHIRRGDFVELGIALPKEYYFKAMSNFDKTQKYIIISDDLNWCKQVFPHTDCIIYADKHVDTNKAIYYDLFIPSLCGKGNIISCSTFNWWGAFLNESESAQCIMPYPWWGYMNDKNLYFNGSIKININSMEFMC